MWNSCSSDSSPWKMLPPIRPYSCSISYGPTTSRWVIEALKPGRDLVVQVDHAGRRTRRAPRCAAPRSTRAGTHWVNSDMMCVPSGFSVLSSVVGMTPSLNGISAGLPDAGVLERRLDELHRRRHLDRSGVMLGHGHVLGFGGEVGQFAQRQVDLHHAAAGLPVLDVGDEVVGQFGARNVVEEGDLRVQRGDDQRRARSRRRSRAPTPWTRPSRTRAARPGRWCGSRRRSCAPTVRWPPRRAPMPPSG